MHYHPITDANKEKILKEIGVSSFDELITGIPAALRNPTISLDKGLSELEVQRLVRRYEKENQSTCESKSFLGGGSYEHFIPASVFELIGRSEFLTAYTPYQPEASQGTLQSIFEFQSLIVELTGLDVSNASHYDGATSMAEAALVALRHTRRNKILIAKSVHPHYREVLQTYLMGTEFEVEEIDFEKGGVLNRANLTEKLNSEIAGFIIQTPNFLGVAEDLSGIGDEVHEAGGLLIQVSHPLSFGYFKSAGEWNADLAVGEGQPLGIPQGFGGPYLGYFAASKALMRKIPGRLAGITTDADGRRAYALTLQAREQHIRRERASSNICTNQALCALAACIYMTLLGKSGIREIAEVNMDRAYYLREKISKLDGFEVDLEQSIFNEFKVKSDKSFSEIEEKMRAKGFFVGVSLEEFYPEFKNEFIVCATETKTKKDLDEFVEALSEC